MFGTTDEKVAGREEGSKSILRERKGVFPPCVWLNKKEERKERREYCVFLLLYPKLILGILDKSPSK